MLDWGVGTLIFRFGVAAVFTNLGRAMFVFIWKDTA